MSAPDRVMVGIDLGGTKVRAGIAVPDAPGALAELERPTASEGGRALVTQLAELVRDLCREASVPLDHLAAIGIGGAGVPDAGQGGFDQAPNLGDVSSVSLVDELRLAVGCPVVLDNDVNVAALGELAAGIGREHDDFAFVSIGTGIGMGLVLGRELVHGAGNAAGEIGYLPFGADPLDPAAHRRGALEEVVAGDALAARYAPGATAREVFARAADGDPRAVSALDEEARWIAHAIAAVDAIVDPGRVVLGGGIGSRPELLEAILGWLDRLGRGRLPVTISALGSAAPVLGALRLASDAATDRTHEGVPA
ncbi:sugar kinase [Agromyces rhizosphaerae]|uniref:Sugar kinase n=1 Tax=Agromyces rhizosphaerae TaxID=88374 RepID=A0A9W6FND9_9MICO|nr:ROK family protein [Agromyces rhizosphaerae]GLI26401.1 sugar kinase [Agromyces rhizosphaerae]